MVSVYRRILNINLCNHLHIINLVKARDYTLTELCPHVELLTLNLNQKLTMHMYVKFGNLQCKNILNVISQTLAHTSLSSLNPSLERDLVNSALSLMRLVTSAIFRTPLKIINKNYLHLYSM